MKYLLDTSVFLWAVGPYELLNKPVQDILKSDSELFFSAASSWEIAIKASIKKLPIPEPPRQYVPRMLLAAGIQTLPITQLHALAVADLPFHNTDPFDRLLVAQAQIEKMVLLTADASIVKYDVETVWSGK